MFECFGATGPWVRSAGYNMRGHDIRFNICATKTWFQHHVCNTVLCSRTRRITVSFSDVVHVQPCAVIVPYGSAHCATS